jgi:erythritol kinase
LPQAARDCYDDLGELPREIRVSGGGARSESLKQILASVMNKSIRSVEREESGAAGAAMIAAVQQGYYDSVDSCVSEWVSPFIGPEVKPDPQDAEIYRQIFPLYKSQRKMQAPAWQHLAQVRQSRSSGEQGHGEYQ